MANENWRPGAGKALPTNVPLRVDLRFSTEGLPGAQDGWVPLDPDYTGQNDWFYRIPRSGSTAGRIFIKAGPSAQNPLLLGFDDYETINAAAANSLWASGKVPGKTGNDAKIYFQTRLQERLEERALQLGIRPTQTQATPPSRTPEGDQRRDPESASPGGDPDLEAATSANRVDLEFLKDMGDQFADNKEPEKYKKWNLHYPATIHSGQDRISIKQLMYVPSLSVAGENGSTFLSESSRFGDPTKEKQTKQKLIGTVTLPMPNDLSESNSVGWGEDSLGNFAAMMMPGLIQFGAGLAATDFGKSGAGVQKLVDALKSEGVGKRAYQYLATNAGASLLKKMNINVNPEAYITRATGAAINPNLELLFNGPKLRQFTLAFKMTPRSQDEARHIRGILQFFKKGMAPRRSLSPENSFFLGTPNVFKINFMGPNNQELKIIGKFKTCALVSFSANYTADGFYAAFQDASVGSQPISVAMQMGFTELTPVYSDEFDLDDDVVNVGPSVFTDKYENKVSGEGEPTDTAEPEGTGTRQGGERSGGRSPGSIDPNSNNQLRGRAR
jgi:hypothetical protein